MEQSELVCTNPTISHGTWPRVTVIVPVYNQAAYVEEALDSILNTGYPNVEIIVINDASPDNTKSVIEAWMLNHLGSNVVFLNHERNLGLTKSLNEAIRLARGEYVCLLAGDDVLLPTGIVDRVRYLRANPQKLAVFADCHVMGPDGTQVHESGIEDLYPAAGMQKQWLVFDKLLPYNIVFHWAVPGPVFMCRAETFAIVGPYDEQLMCEDWDMFLRIAATGRLGFLPAYVAKYRVHSANLCSTQQARIETDRYLTAKKNGVLFRGANALGLLTYMKRFEYLHARGSSSRFLSYLVYRICFLAADYWYRCHRKLIKLLRRPRNGPADRNQEQRGPLGASSEA